MAHGNNTDVLFDSVLYHVQTEDRGAAHASIESLVYHGGQILHQERCGYADLQEPGADPEDIQRRLDAQHRNIVRRARHGEFFTKSRVSLLDRVPEGEPLAPVVAGALPALGFAPLELDCAPGEGAARLQVRRDGDPAAGVRVTARLVAPGEDPRTLWTVETGPDGTADAPAWPAGPGAVVLVADGPDGGGRLRVELVAVPA